MSPKSATRITTPGPQSTIRRWWSRQPHNEEGGIANLDPTRLHMRKSSYFRFLCVLCPVLGLLCSALDFSALHLRAQSLPLEPVHETGSSVTGAFEGWFKNPDGTFSLLLG